MARGGSFSLVAKTLCFFSFNLFLTSSVVEIFWHHLRG